jgi:hypothetical protein
MPTNTGTGAVVSTGSTWRSSTRARSDEGAIAAEHTGVLVVIGVVIAAVVALPVAPQIASWGAYAVCSLFGDGGCARPGSEITAATDEEWFAGDLENCTVLAATSGVESNLDIMWASLAGAEGYEVVQHADGTTTVTYDRQIGAGGNVGTGGGINVHFGEESFNYEASAGATGLWTMGGGQTLTFASPEDAQAYVDWHQRVGVATDRYDHLHWIEYVNPLAWGGSRGVGARVDGWIAGATNSVAGWFGGGVDDPPPPVSAVVHHAGGWDLDASAQWGLATADAGASLSNQGQIGYSEDLATGDKVYYYELSSEALLQAGIAQNAPRFEVGAGGNSLVAISVDAYGRPQNLDVVTYTVGDPGLDPATFDNPMQLIGNSGFARAGDGIDASLYQITMSMPIDRVPSAGEVMGNLINGGGGGGLAGDLVTDGYVHMVEYDVEDRRYGLDLGLGLFGIGGGGGVASVTSDRSAVAAHFLSDPGGENRAWRPSLSCAS